MIHIREHSDKLTEDTGHALQANNRPDGIHWHKKFDIGRVRKAGYLHTLELCKLCVTDGLKKFQRSTFNVQCIQFWFKPFGTVSWSDRAVFSVRACLRWKALAVLYSSIMTEPTGKDTSGSDFLSTVLTPGSSLSPTFLLVVDGVLALLALTLISLIVVSGGSVHPIALLLIELALWVSIKW
jgi:hypothetical protein